eukprot:scaffold6986_cov190-Amphora_coffeaeformis.AAC.3
MRNSNSSNDKQAELPVPQLPLENQEAERHVSVDSAAFFEGGDEYDDYDDFAAGNGGGGGGGKTEKRQQNRGGGGSGTIYSAKHVRQKEALKNTTKTTIAPKK